MAQNWAGAPQAPASKFVPALIGGLIAGFLSAIPIINYCCCLWSLGGGVVASLMYIKKSPLPVRPGEGAMVGALAGLIAGLIYLILGVPLAYLIAGPATLESQLRHAGIQVPVAGLLLVLLGGLIGAVGLVILTALGGLLGVPIFEKRKDGAGAAPPPPPPGFGT
jgi:hypothetical protein